MAKPCRPVPWLLCISVIFSASASTYVNTTFYLGSCGIFFRDNRIYQALAYAAQLAMDDGFFDHFLTHRFNLSIQQVETLCSEAEAASEALPFFLGKGNEEGRIYSATESYPPVIGIAGCMCSGATKVVSNLGLRSVTPIVSGASTSPDLSVKLHHPWFMRTISPDSVQGRGLLGLVSHFGWKKCMVLKSLSSVSAAIADYMIPLAGDAGIDMMVFELPETDLTFPEYEDAMAWVTQIAAIRPQRRVFVFTWSPNLHLIMSIALMKVGLLSSTSVHLASEQVCTVASLSWTDNLLQDGRPVDVNRTTAAGWGNLTEYRNFDYAEGLLCLEPFSRGPLFYSSKFEQFWSSLTCDRLRAAGMAAETAPCNEALISTLDEMASQSYYPLMFDAVTALIAAIGRMLAAGTPPGEISGSAYFGNISTIMFEGLSGNVAFDSNGDRLAPYLIRNLQLLEGGAPDLREIGHYDGAANTVVFDSAPVWHGGGAEVPPESPPDCAFGEEYVDAFLGCQACPLGRYFPLSGGSMCVDCSAGQYRHQSGMNQCETCPAGHYCPAATVDPIPCGLGHFCVSGAKQPSLCPPGEFTGTETGTACEQCEKGTYSSETGSSACKSCEDTIQGSSTPFVGHISSSACRCSEGSYLTSAAGEGSCASCGFLMTSDVGSSSDEDCHLASSGIVVIAASIFLLLAVLGAGALVRHKKNEYQALANNLLQERLQTGLAAVKNLAHPMVIISMQSFRDLPLESLRTLHEGCRNAGYLITLDTIEAIEEFKRQGMTIVFFSYQWLSWTIPGPNDIQISRMQSSLCQLCDAQGLQFGKTFVWLDILSIPQCNDSLKGLAVNSLYTYAGQADWLVIIAPDSEHENLKSKADAHSYKQRVWCRAEQMAFFCFRGVDRMFLVTDSMRKVPDTWIHDVASIFNGSMTCCTLEHKGGAPCDRTSLVSPLTGMYFDLYTKQKLDSLDANGKRVWEFVEANKDTVFPTKYDHVMDNRKPQKRELFGNLIMRIERFVDKDVEKARAMSTSKSSDAGASHQAHNNKAVRVSTLAPRDESQTIYI